MTKTCTRVILAAVVLVVGASSAADAQESRFAVSVKAGATSENSEDGLTGTVPALGVALSVSFTPGWRTEIEYWLPGYLEDDFGQPKHRDVLFSVAAVRTFTTGRSRPFVLAGLSFSRTQDWFTFCTAERVLDSGGLPVPTMVSCGEPDVIERRRERHDGKDGYLLVGGGLEAPISARLSFVADLRASLAPASLLIRPAGGVAMRF